MSSTRILQHINAPHAAVYRALLDPAAIARWKVPEGMSCEVHQFEPREGGALRISLTYDAATEGGKTSAHTDTYQGRFTKLVPNEQVVEVDEFETDDPSMRGEMTVTITLTDADGGTDLLAVQEVAGSNPAGPILSRCLTIICESNERYLKNVVYPVGVSRVVRCALNPIPNSACGHPATLCAARVRPRRSLARRTARIA